MDIDRYVASCVVHLAFNFPKMFCDWVPLIVCIHDWVRVLLMNWSED